MAKRQYEFPQEIDVPTANSKIQVYQLQERQRMINQSLDIRSTVNTDMGWLDFLLEKRFVGYLITMLVLYVNALFVFCSSDNLFAF